VVREPVDLSPLARALVPIVSVRQDNVHYFDLHHSAADTLDKVNPFELAQVAAEVGWVAYALAEMPRALPRPAASATASTPAGAAGPAAPLSPASSTTSSAAAAGARK